MFKCELICFVLFCYVMFEFGFVLFLVVVLEKKKKKSGREKKQIHIVLLLSVEMKYIHQLKSSILSSCAVVVG